MSDYVWDPLTGRLNSFRLHFMRTGWEALGGILYGFRTIHSFQECNFLGHT